jgi:hypothetical protein
MVLKWKKYRKIFKSFGKNLTLRTTIRTNLKIAKFSQEKDRESVPQKNRYQSTIFPWK